jgi:hypothetical protein
MRRNRWILGIALLLTIVTAKGVKAGEGYVRKHAGAIAGEYAIGIQSELPAEATARDLVRRYGGRVNAVFAGLHAFTVHLDDESTAQTLSLDDRVRYIEQDVEVALSAGSQATNIAETCVANCTDIDWHINDDRLWHLDRIDQETGLNNQYNYCYDGSGVTVFMLDTGIFRDHGEFGATDSERKARVGDGFDVSGEEQATLPCGGFASRELWESDAQGYSLAVLNMGHGTSTASLVNGVHVGVAKGARVVPVKYQSCDQALMPPWMPNRAHHAGEWVKTANARRFKAVRAGVSGNNSPDFDTAGEVTDGTVVWRAYLKEPAPASAIAAAMEWISRNAPPRSVASISGFTLVGAPPIDPPIRDDPKIIPCAIGDPDTGAPAIMKLLQDAIAKLGQAHVALFASANNQNECVIRTAPANIEKAGLLTVGGSMLLNDPDGDLSMNADYGHGPVPEAGQAVRDALWLVGAGDTTKRTDTGDEARSSIGSNFGSAVRIFAPARNITSAGGGGPHDYRGRLSGSLASGTSFAAPITAGVAARLLSISPGTSLDETNVIDTILNSAVPDILEDLPNSPHALQGSVNRLLYASDIMFETQPAAGQPLQAGESVTLRADVIAPFGVSYEWFKGAWRNEDNPSNVSAGHDSSLLVAATNPATDSAAYYFLRVSLPAGECPTDSNKHDSRVVRVRVHNRLAFADPLKTKPTASPGVVAGKSGSLPQATLQAPGFLVESGDPALTYTWFQGAAGQNDHPIGQQQSIMVGPAVSTKYWVRATLSDGGFIDSDSLLVPVVSGNSITVEGAKPDLIPKVRANDNSGTPGGGELTAILHGDAAGALLHWYIDAQPTCLVAPTTICRTSFMPLAPDQTTHSLKVTASVASDGAKTEKDLTDELRFSPCLMNTPVFDPVSTSTHLVVQNASGTCCQWFEGPPDSGAAATQRTGRPIAGQTGNSFDIPNTKVDRTYWVRVYNSGGCYAESDVHVSRASQSATRLPPRPFKPYTVEMYPTTTIAVDTSQMHPLSHFEWYAGTTSGATESSTRIGSSVLTDAGKTDEAKEHRWWLNLSKLTSRPQGHSFWARVYTWDGKEYADSDVLTLPCTYEECTPPPASLTVKNIFTAPGIPTVFEASLMLNGMPLAGEELSFSVLGQSIGTARTGADGRATILHTVQAPIGNHLGGVVVTYGGPLAPPPPPPAPAGDLNLSCFGALYSWSPNAVNVKGALSATIRVTAPADCSWKPFVPASSNWITIAGMKMGTQSCPNGVCTGNGTFTISAPDLGVVNTGSVTLRSATDQDLGSSIPVVRSPDCTFRITPAIAFLPAERDPANAVTVMNVSAPDGCPWTASSPDGAWIRTITSDVQAHTLQFAAEDNTDEQTGHLRTAHISINGLPLATIIQAGRPPTTCPSILIDVRDGTVADGQDIVINVFAKGSDLHYTWYADGRVIAPAVGDDLDAPEIVLSPLRYGSYLPNGSQPVRWYSVVITSSCGTIGSRGARWSLTGDPSCSSFPRIDSQPRSQISPAASTPIRLRVEATALAAGSTLKYRWYAGLSGDRTSPIGDATADNTLLVSPMTTSFYWCDVLQVSGNLSCSTPSATAYVIITSKPRGPAIPINVHPKNTSAPAGSTASFTVVPGITGVRYQWFEGPSTTRPVGGDSPTLSVVANGPSSFWARLSADAYDDTDSLSATLSICTLPRIETQPQTSYKQIPAGGASVDVSTSVTASGGLLHYEWHVYTDGLTPGDTVGGDSSTLTLPFSASHPTGTYYVRVYDNASPTGCAGQVWSAPVTIGVADVNACVHIVSGGGDYLVSNPVINAFHLGIWAQGTGEPFTYEWYHGINGQAVKLSYTTADIVIGVSGEYDAIWCVVKCTSATCNGASITTEKAYMRRWDVCPLPPVTVLPAKFVTPPQVPATPTFTAYCDWPRVTYQWYIGSSGVTTTPVPNGTGKSISPNPSVTTSYWVRVTNECGTAHEDSETVAFSVGGCDPVVITAQPHDVNVAAGETPSLSAFSPNADSYTWYEQGTSTPVGYGPNFVVPSHKTLKTTTFVSAVVNSCNGVFTVPATVHVKSCGTFGITVEPLSQPVIAGSTTPVVLTVAATQAPEAYQWYAGDSGDTTHPVGTNSNTYQVVPTDTAKYWARLKLGSCEIDSETAVLTWCTPPHFLTNAGVSNIRLGQVVFFQSDADGTDLQYEWRLGAINGPLLSTDPWLYQIPANTTTYYQIVKGLCGAPISEALTVQVCQSPSIIEQPHGIAVFPGKTTTLSVHAIEGLDPTISYQWLDENGIAVGSNPTFTTPPITAEKRYSVHLQAGICTTDSDEATVSLCVLPEVVGGGTLNVASGQVVTLHIPISPYDDNAFQWYRGPAGDVADPVTGANSNDLVLFASQPATYWATVTHNGDHCVSHTAAYTINICAPTITTQPANAMRMPNQSVALSVVAAPATAWQWYIGAKGDVSAPVAGGTSTLNVSPTVDTRYWVRVTGSCGLDPRDPAGTTDSESALVTVCQPPAITQAGSGGAIGRGASIALFVTATGTSLTYQWYIGSPGNTSSPISGATGDTITVSPQNTTTYWVRVSGACSPAKDSGAMTISVCLSPVITTQPQSASIFSGATATLSVIATEGTTSPISYQWYRGSSGDTSTAVGTNAPTYTTPALTTATSYWVRVSCGTCTPASSQTATVSICALPAIVGGSGDVETQIGQSTTLFVSATGSNYAWYTGAAGDTSHLYVSGYFQSINVAPAVTTQYWAQVTNGSCLSRTNTITVKVCVPRITQHPQGSTIPSGSSVTLTTAADMPVTYQWYTGNTGTTTSPIPGATGASLTVTPTATTSYWARVTSTACGRTADSATATITVCASTAITRQPSDAGFVTPGGTSTVDVLASGLALTYQWYSGESGDVSNPIDGRSSNSTSTTATLSMPITQTLRVWARVTGQCGPPANSRAVWMTVIPTVFGPGDQTVSAGSTVALSVAAIGAGPLATYQWVNGSTNTNFTGATSTTFVLSSVTAPLSVYCKVTSGTATVFSRLASIDVCSGPSVSVSWTNNGPSCRFINASISGDYTGIEWYKGQPGDTSTFVASGQTSIMVCPTATTTYWCRVYGTDAGTGTECNATSGGVTVSP